MEGQRQVDRISHQPGFSFISRDASQINGISNKKLAIYDTFKKVHHYRKEATFSLCQSHPPPSACRTLHPSLPNTRHHRSPQSSTTLPITRCGRRYWTRSMPRMKIAVAVPVPAEEPTAAGLVDPMEAQTRTTRMTCLGTKKATNSRCMRGKAEGCWRRVAGGASRFFLRTETVRGVASFRGTLSGCFLEKPVFSSKAGAMSRFFQLPLCRFSTPTPNAISAWRERRRFRRHTRSAGHSLGVQIRAVGPAGDPAVPLLGRCGEGACVPAAVGVRRRTCC